MSGDDSNRYEEWTLNSFMDSVARENELEPHDCWQLLTPILTELGRDEAESGYRGSLCIWRESSQVYEIDYPDFDEAAKKVIEGTDPQSVRVRACCHARPHRLRRCRFADVCIKRTDAVAICDLLGMRFPSSWHQEPTVATTDCEPGEAEGYFNLQRFFQRCARDERYRASGLWADENHLKFASPRGVSKLYFHKAEDPRPLFSADITDWQLEQAVAGALSAQEWGFAIEARDSTGECLAFRLSNALINRVEMAMAILNFPGAVFPSFWDRDEDIRAAEDNLVRFRVESRIANELWKRYPNLDGFVESDFRDACISAAGDSWQVLAAALLALEIAARTYDKVDMESSESSRMFALQVLGVTGVDFTPEILRRLCDAADEVAPRLAAGGPWFEDFADQLAGILRLARESLPEAQSQQTQPKSLNSRERDTLLKIVGSFSLAIIEGRGPRYVRGGKPNVNAIARVLVDKAKDIGLQGLSDSTVYNKLAEALRLTRDESPRFPK